MAAADLRTILRLAFRHLVVRRGRAAVLLVGYAIGAGVMMTLLSVGEALITQSRDVSLVGGGEVTVLPSGIDLEGLRTGSIAGMFFGIDRARFLERQLIGGPAQSDVVAATSPTIERELLYLIRGRDLIPIRAGAEIPSRGIEVGASLRVSSGQWVDTPADSTFIQPTRQELYDELDRFHTPWPDSSWAEWHYFNVAPSGDEWWYVTYIIGGDLAAGRGGGQLLITRHRGGLPPARFSSVSPADAVRFDTLRADLALGSNTVTQRDGTYRIRGTAAGASGTVRFDLAVVPQANAYFPSVEIRGDRFVSGYVVPGLRATASGSLCEGATCREIDGVAAYHDHNWGVWRETTWNWGQARGERMSVVYGGVLTADSAASLDASPYFLALVDSLGVRQVLRFGRIDYRGARPVEDVPGVRAPESFSIRAGRDGDSVAIDVAVRRAHASRTGFPGVDRIFLQLRGSFRLTGRVLGREVADSGLGFFETFIPNP